MKKLFLVLAAAFAMVACQTDLNEVSVAGGEVDVTFQVGAPAARAYSDGTTATVLQYAVYEGKELTAELLPSLTVTDGEINISTTVRMQLVTGNTYTVVFWAAAEGAPYRVDFAQTLGEAAVTVNYEGAVCNDENRDAFFKSHTFTVTGAQTEVVELRRPFAQLNIGTNDYTASENAGYVPVNSYIKVPVYSTLKLATGAVEGQATQVFNYNTIDKTQQFPVAGDPAYKYLAMSYLLVDADKETVDVVFGYSEGDAAVAKTRTVGSVPVQRNYRTNIYGQLLTSDVDIVVEIKPEYANDALEAWDGVTLNEPTFNAETKTYYISHAAELAYIAALVNGTLDTDNVSRVAVAKNSLKGYTLSLECDINLNGKEWTPIGMGGNHFQGTLKGNNCTIHGLKISERPNGTSQAALFGTVSGTVAISDLTIKGANINGLAYTDQDFYGSALIGTMYGDVTIENVNVVDSYISGNNKVGALLAHDGVCSSLKISGCVVDNVTFESTCVADGGLVGGLVGFFQGVAPTATSVAPYGEHNIVNSHVKNSTFNVVNSTNSGKRGNSQFIGGILSKANQTLYIDGCSVSNNTWNEKFYAGGVEVTEGKYESLFVAEDIVWIGGERNDNANGKVIVNGVEIVLLKPIIYTEDSVEKKLEGIGTMGKTTNAAGDEFPVYGVINADGLKSINKLIELASTNARTDEQQYVVEGATFKLLADVDLLELNENGEPVCFKPIGDYRTEKPFTGILDGQGHTIKNLNQNTWELDYGYYYTHLGLGLFSCIENATIKNLNVDKASISGESAICGVVAATAYGECTFENITVTNSQCADYQYYAGGIVGWASGNHKYINCNLDATTTVATQWGDFDNSTGGVIGGAGGSATILMKDCTVACRIDAHSDVVSAYRWYAYRRCGMLIGNSGKTETVDGRTVAIAPQLTCENVEVIYGDWANYTYCQFSAMDYPYVRVQAGVSVSAYSNVRYGHPTDANGNTVVDDNHAHNEGEDHHLLIAFDQLYGGGQGVYGQPTHEGVTVIYNNK